MAHSTNTWSLCDTPTAPYDFDEWLLEENRRMAYQGQLDDCSDYNVFKIDLEKAQQPLKPSIRPPGKERESSLATFQQR